MSIDEALVTGKVVHDAFETVFALVDAVINPPKMQMK
jgi:hypothetical protein